MSAVVNASKSKPASDAGVLLQSLVGFGVAALVMIGVGGSVYHLVAPGGWLAQLFGRSVAGGSAALLAFLVIGLCAWLLRAWISITRRNRYSELFVYAFALAGAVYTWKLLMAK